MRIERSENTYPIQVKFTNGEDHFRTTNTAVVYKDYDKDIRLKLNSCGLGFHLELEDAIRVRDLLSAAIKELQNES